MVPFVCFHLTPPNMSGPYSVILGVAVQAALHVFMSGQL